MPSVVVVHAGRRDHYEVAIALHEHHLLCKLVTTGYGFRSRHRLLGRVLSQFSRYRLGMLDRYGKELPESCVTSSLLAEVLQQVGHGVFGGDLASSWARRRLGSTAARIARANHSTAILSYNYTAYMSFQGFGASKAKRLLFQCHPHPETARRILLEERSLVPAASSGLGYEAELSWSDDELLKLSTESRLADGIIVASSFTRQSLIENGVEPHRIRVVPYGSDWPTLQHGSDEKPVGRAGRFRILFVGQMLPRKGLHYLIDACRGMDMTNTALAICGRGLEWDFTKFYGLPPWMEVHRNLSDKQLADQYRSADVFVLPSLLEGFGLVLLEAMRFGLPVITTPHTGGPDIISDGENGFVVPVRNPAALAAAISRLRFDAGLRQRISRAALATADLFSWARFRSGVAQAVLEFLN